jgi:hypothetical protein
MAEEELWDYRGKCPNCLRNVDGLEMVTGWCSKCYKAYTIGQRERSREVVAVLKSALANAKWGQGNETILNELLARLEKHYTGLPTPLFDSDRDTP